MRLNDLELLIGKAAGLAQDIIGNADLSAVMEECAVIYLVELFSLVSKLFRYLLRILGNTVGVTLVYGSLASMNPVKVSMDSLIMSKS